MALSLTKSYTPSAGQVANSTSYNTDIAALFNAFTNLEADPPTSSMANFCIDATGKLYLDGAGNTYIYESAADKISLVAGGTEALRVVNDDIGIAATGKIFLDGVALSGNTYLHESSADTIVFVTGGSNALTLTSAQITQCEGDMSVPATNKVYLDGQGNTYITESGADVVDIYTGGSLTFRCVDDNKSQSPNGMYIGNKQDSALLDDATTGSATTVMYIGNESITTSSDVRIKKNIENTKVDALRMIDELNVVDFDWKNDTYERGRWTGILAQELKKIAPWVVNDQGAGDCPKCNNGEPCTDHPNPWVVKYEYLVPVLIKAVQDLQAKIKKLEAFA